MKKRGVEWIRDMEAIIIIQNRKALIIELNHSASAFFVHTLIDDKKAST